MTRTILALALFLTAAPAVAQVGPVGPAGPQGDRGADGENGRDGRDAVLPEPYRETSMLLEWRWPVRFVPGVDQTFEMIAATPDRLPIVGYYYRAPGPFQGWLILADANRDRDALVALKWTGELWATVGAVQERTLKFVGPATWMMTTGKPGAPLVQVEGTRTYMVNLTTLLAYLGSRPGNEMRVSSLSAFVNQGELPRVTTLDDDDLRALVARQ